MHAVTKNLIAERIKLIHERERLRAELVKTLNEATALRVDRRQLRLALDMLLHATLFKDHPEESTYAIEILRATDDAPSGA